MGLLEIIVPGDVGTKGQIRAQAQRMADDHRYKPVGPLEEAGTGVDANGNTVHYYQVQTDKPTPQH